MRASAQDWLTKATLDLEAAGETRGVALHAWSVHMARQSAEFALKAAWQGLRNEPAPQHHNLQQLATGLKADVPEIVAAALHHLAPHYTLTRYPDAGLGIPDYHYGPDDSQAAVEHAQEVLQWVQSLIRKNESSDK